MTNTKSSTASLIALYESGSLTPLESNHVVVELERRGDALDETVLAWIDR